MADLERLPPIFKFTTHHSASAFSVPYETHVSSQPEGTYKYQFVANGAMVFDFSSPKRILLLQRAAHDSMPNRWEVPGGACDREDESILHSVARELWEEAGLVATSIGPQIGDGQMFLTRSGKIVCKFHFLVEAEKGPNGRLDVKLDPNEHQNYVWATEEEVKARTVRQLELNFTTREQEAAVLRAFNAAS